MCTKFRCLYLFLYIFTVESHIMTVHESKCFGVRCKLGKCIPPVEICDEIPNCPEGTDENFENCEFKRTHCIDSPHDPACGDYPLVHIFIYWKVF